jgi:ribosome-associated toxin RatA of RatAB toxin-antitoxin module
MGRFYRQTVGAHAMLKSILFAVFLLTLSTVLLAQQAAGDGIKINVRKDGDAVIIDLSVIVAATPQETWDVLVDYDHMTQFMSNLQASKIVEKNGNNWTVAQKGQTSHGLFSFAFENVRMVELDPYKTIRSHLISGTLKKLDGITQLIPSGDVTRIVYHSESISNVWMPPMVGVSLVEDQVRKQFQEMQAEIMRRKATTPSRS